MFITITSISVHVMKIISPRSTSTVLLLVLLVGTTYKERSNLLGGGGGGRGQLRGAQRDRLEFV